MAAAVAVVPATVATAKAAKTTQVTATQSTPSTALSPATSAAGCPTVATAQVFKAFGDTASYAAVIGGNMETSDGWLLYGSSYVLGNDSYFLSAATDRYSLKLPSGSLANAPWLCTGSAFPTARLMVKNIGAASGTLRVDAQYIDATSGVIGNVHIADISATSVWSPSPILALPLPTGADQYRLNFMPQGTGASFQIDDLFVDPMRTLK